MNRSILAAAAPALALLVSPAAAQDVTKAYVQVHGGVFGSTSDELSVETEIAGGEETEAAFGLDTDLGHAVGGLVGYDVLLGFSVEADLTYRTNDVALDDDAGFDAGTGELETVSFLVNGVYTINVPFLADPYVGLGAGYVTPIGDSDEFDGAFAYQAKAGLAWPVGLGRIITEVSYLGTTGLAAEEGDGLGETEFELDYGGVSATLGYRFAF